MQQLGGEDSLVPQPRGNLPRICACLLAAVLAVVMLMIAPVDFIGLVARAILMLTVGSSLHGLCFLAEEWMFHTTTRYRGQGYLVQMLSACVGVRTLLSVGLAVFLLVLVPDLAGDHHTEGRNNSLLILVSGLYPILKILGVLGPCQVEVSSICEEMKNNVAHGLAWSFYLGYLKLVLPRLKDSIKAFCATHSDSLFQRRGSRRLLLLLPLNANIAHKLEDEDTNIHFYANLPNVELDRAGVRGRVYKHSVYDVLDENGKSHQCVVEYATPLLTLYQMSHESSAGLGEKERREQVLLFYKTLQDILEHSLDCKNCYTLILLNDQHEDDPHFLSKTILKSLLQQEKEEYCVVDNRETDNPMSRVPTLMISHDSPRSLRAPVETDELEHRL